MGQERVICMPVKFQELLHAFEFVSMDPFTGPHLGFICREAPLIAGMTSRRRRPSAPCATGARSTRSSWPMTAPHPRPRDCAARDDHRQWASRRGLRHRPRGPHAERRAGSGARRAEAAA